MRFFHACMVVLCAVAPAFAQEKTEGGPQNEKAQKTFKQAQADLHEGRAYIALGGFKKADQQDGGHCHACQKQMIKYGLQLEEWKIAELACEEMIAEANGEK